MNVIAIYGNPKEDGFVHGCLDVIVQCLRNREVDVEPLYLRDVVVADCIGCFDCLRTGVCVLNDDINAICRRMRAVDGYVIGCSVRNGYVTSLYKRFYERITFPLQFTGDLTGKYVLSVSAVGKMGGRRSTKALLGLEGVGANHTGHLFFHTGIPTRLTVDAVRNCLQKAVGQFVGKYERKWRPGPLVQFGRRIDRFVLSHFMFRKHPDIYRHVIDCYRKRGWMK